jgi:glycosyltransferase involved in cell wall biosynthesis
MYQYYKLYRDIKPDMLLIYTIKPNIYGSIVSKILNIPTINVIAGLGTVFLDNRISSKLARWLYRIALFNNKVIFENRDDSVEFIKRDIIKKQQAVVIWGSGIDTEQFKPKKIIKRDKQDITFLLIARLIKDKGILEYIEAIKSIRVKYPTTKFQILGSYYFDNPSAISEDEVKSWVNEGIIDYLGYTDAVLEKIEKVDCVVLPSYREGLSRVLLEAGSMLKPIITTDVTGCREVVDNGYNGFLVSAKDSKSLAMAMEKMINLSNRERIQMGIRGRLKIINEFDDKIVIKKYLNAISLSHQKFIKSLSKKTVL